MRHRHVGLGAKCSAAVYMMRVFPFESEAVSSLDIDIFEAIYFATCEASCGLAEREGAHETCRAIAICSVGLHAVE